MRSIRSTSDRLRLLLFTATLGALLAVGDLIGGTMAQASAPHRIRVRQGGSGGEFYDTVTGLKFTPRGNNYVRLAWQTDSTRAGSS